MEEKRVRKDAWKRTGEEREGSTQPFFRCFRLPRLPIVVRQIILREQSTLLEDRDHIVADISGQH